MQTVPDPSAPGTEEKRRLSQAVKAEAGRLGFQLAGITSAEPPPHLGVFREWLQAGYHGEMGYLATERARERRADPRQILPDCRSILCLGVRYPSPIPPEATVQPVRGAAGGAPTGRLASYAWGSDYHEALKPRLRDLVTFIDDLVGHPVPNRWYTDTGPILERDLAERAGLGWIGKNTCLIHPQMGSYFLLAEILLGLDLEPDRPFTMDHCGSCTRCIDACPTDCILPDRTIDARRCISYLTIELKGPIPPDLREGLGNWIFGCDICQEVCPWNEKFAVPEGDADFAPRPGLPEPALLEEIDLSPTEFNRKFKGSPIKRPKRRGYLRNVAVALGNSQDPQAVPALARALHTDREPLVRGHAAWALGKILLPAARRVLEEALGREADRYVRQEIEAALNKTDPSAGLS